MIFPSLSDAERAVLEDLLLHGPNRNLPTPIRGRLGLYKLIDETPEGWKITPFGQQALQVAPAANAPAQASRKEGRGSEHERHYGKKSRDTSWFG
jgi:hypothetical protein